MKIIGKNPITGLDYPDPDVIRVDDTYYMVSTTMHFVPGCEILRSYDLVHWEHLSYVYERLDSTEEQRLVGEKNCYGKGMWAASLRYHKGMYYICFVANDTGKTYLYTADNIEGPWEKRIIEGFYHDCSLLFEDDHVYIVSGNRNIRLQELKKDLSGPKEGGLDRILVSDSRNPGLGFEGSHFYKIDGMYYLFLIHSLPDRWMRTQACYVSDSLTGEFKGGDVLCDTMGYCGQGVAQGGIVDTPDHKWYAVLFQDRGAVGRIPVLVPVKWEKNVRVTCMPAPGEQKEQIIKENYPVLGVDYDGTRSANSESSVNYSIQEYVNDSISTLVDASDKNGIPHPNIITESGRSLTAHHSVLIFEVLETATLPEMDEDFEVGENDHELVHELYEIWDNLNQSRMVEAWHDAQQIREEALDLFSHGIVDLKTRAQIERLYWSVTREIGRAHV